MTEYRATYKCRLCGETFQNAIMGEAVAQVTIFELATVGNTQNIKCNGNLHKHAIHYCNDGSFHYCNDGSFGLADFQGFKKINKEWLKTEKQSIHMPDMLTAETQRKKR